MGIKMTTVIDRLKKGSVPENVVKAASIENISQELMIEGLIAGEIVLPNNVNREFQRPVAIGKGLRTKVNANIGTSSDFQDIDYELKKLQTALEAGADAVMDLSTAGNLDSIRSSMISRCSVPLGTVPIYQAMVESQTTKGSMIDMTVDEIFAVIEKHAKSGVDFITVHSGITRDTVESLKRGTRVAEVVSRGGAMTVAWMLRHDKENPLYEYFDRLVGIAREYDVTLSLGDGMRPGCIADASDQVQFQELLTLGQLVEISKAENVQALVEGPGHMPFDQIESNVRLEKEICGGAPYYLLGPLVTDIAPGYDHITAAIGGTMAASKGADFLCYVTPREHLGLPTLEDVHDGVIVSRIAGHAADIVKGVPGASDWDLKMAKARKSLDWKAQQELAIDPAKARDSYEERKGTIAADACTMCSEFCAMKLISDYLEVDETPIC